MVKREVPLGPGLEFSKEVAENQLTLPEEMEGINLGLNQWRTLPTSQNRISTSTQKITMFLPMSRSKDCWLMEYTIKQGMQIF